MGDQVVESERSQGTNRRLPQKAERYLPGAVGTVEHGGGEGWDS